MSVLEEIKSEARDAGSALEEAQASMRDAAQAAEHLEQDAAAHGWAGMAEAMAAAQETTDRVSAAVDDSLRATTAGITALAEITGEPSTAEIARRLATAREHLDSARRTALDAASALDDAQSVARQTEAPRLLELLDSAEEHLSRGQRHLESAARVGAAEQSAAEAWGGASRRDGAPRTRQDAGRGAATRAASSSAAADRTTARPPPGGRPSSGSRPGRSSPGPDERVADVLRRKKGSIKNAPLGRGSPSWDAFAGMTLRDIEAGARANKPGYKTALKLLRDRRFDR